MKKITKRIEIVSSSVARLSSMSDRSRRAIKKVLERYYTDVRIVLIDDQQGLDDLVKRNPDLVFLALQFLPKNSDDLNSTDDVIWVAKFLSQNGIAHTGSPSVAHELELNKPFAKERLLENNLATAAYQVAQLGQVISEQDVSLKYPLFIKPANRGGGLGVDEKSLVYNFEQLKSKVNSIFELDSDALIEEFLPGREFSVAILRRDSDSDLLALPIELVASENAAGLKILSGDTKSANSEQVIKITDNDLREKVCTLALDAFAALGARDYGRIDIRLDGNDLPHFLEANLMPSLIDGYGSFPKACMLNMSLEYEDMILGLVDLAIERCSFDEILDGSLQLEPAAFIGS